MSSSELSVADVVVVDLALTAQDLARCAAILDPGERARAARFLRPEDRDRFVASHAALRLLLGQALGTDPAAVAFTAGPAGKPELAGAARGALHFNLSHSGRFALVGLARAAIGVDVEAVRPLPDALRIARGQFAPDEAAALAALPRGQVEAVFFGLWTRKEAVVKALGAGLSLPLARFSVSLPPAEPRLLRMPGGAAAWSLAAVEVGPGAAATVAVAAPDAVIAVRTLPPGWTENLGRDAHHHACGPPRAQL
ncbi:4'-phosphopantetheinyl transferase superfamily protein [Methylobacterium sp. NEAU 140]|uniref:4'-phosphopantetheinyl transferase family protein n=1 Tax=Methylobacterium sp. NEAU 140 TaxID=3064945 RepID=UPI00273362C8|nr:4'-phosphopantetheinyl transferase superfamily protein [Methylobacterium sp. NEAU 140]MDP4021180.1 4'-phosphopantetheinyl transferase superfamily protein [Methylobacterium sp. NEAU 140]